MTNRKTATKMEDLFVTHKNNSNEFTSYRFIKTQVPNPNWRPHTKSKDAGGEAINITDTSDKEKVSLEPSSSDYKFITSAIAPRPIALISTLSPSTNAQQNRIANVAPFSFFNVMTKDPVTFSFGLSPVKNGYKDTANNLISTKQCVINLVSEDIVQQANFTSIEVPGDVDEFELAGLRKGVSEKIDVPYVKDCVVSIECELLHTIEVPLEYNTVDGKDKEPNLIFIVKAVKYHVDKDAIDLSNRAVDMELLKPVSRLIGITYGRTTKSYDICKPPADMI
ncbi:uncharacterized protein SCODWIG_00738 [Saccharomycodes ludwigii]|uniref:Flavin reductase like domain-containing protein n=1 Tax=Saccharomycodes ludwigii TaxID=36035 RepID=A0A376B2S9_9ASCO|nr:conserved putative flavoprotein oxygenase [Saccharomycodes ludwigii]KAH3901779.1 conserved putative flavoprotein oxygenase [Saccharomycodes ludwigii]SSD58977.1 uncharacterized protein SCODWIG_00738 [Saccharomycodes ludwigii]